MKVELSLSVEYADEREAAMVLAALGPDNEGYLTSSQQGRVIHFLIESSSVGTLRNSVDDLLACLRAAEETLSIGADPVPDPDGDALLE